MLSKGVYRTGLYGKRAFIILRDVMVYEANNPSNLRPYWQTDSIYDDAHFYFQYPDHDAHDDSYWALIKYYLQHVKNDYGCLGYNNPDNVIPYHYMIRSHTTFADDGEIIFPFFSTWKEQEDLWSNDGYDHFSVSLADRLNFFWKRLTNGTAEVPNGNNDDTDSYSQKLSLSIDETKKLFCSLENYFGLRAKLDRFKKSYTYKTQGEVFEKYALKNPFNPIQVGAWTALRDEAHSVLSNANLFGIFSGYHGQAEYKERVSILYSKLISLYKQSLEMIE